MRTSWKRFTALAGSAMLVAGAGPPLLGGADDSALQVEGFTVSGNFVHVAVHNTSDETLSGTVYVRMLLTSGEMGAMAPVTVAEGQKVFVGFLAPSPIEGILAAGVVLDDGSPF